MPDGDDLLRCLAALQRTQAAWLADLDATLPNEQAFASVFRRWQEQLTSAKLHLHRSEDRLLHFVISPQADPHRDLSPPALNDHDIARAWRRRFDQWFATIHLDTTYRRLESVRDLDGEPVNADIVTDLSVLAELATHTAPILARIAESRDLASAQDAAFYGVLSPWRVRGMAPLHDTLRWLGETLADEGEL